MSVTRSRYQCDDGDIFAIYLAEKTLAANGGGATGALTNTSMIVYASNRGNKRSLAPRRVFLRRELGTVGEGDDQRTVYAYASIVVCLPASYTSILSEDTIEYADETWEVIGGQAES